MPQNNQNQKRRRFQLPRRRKKPEHNYAFIDAQNLNLGTQKVGFKMNWKKFCEFLRDRYDVTTAYMFIGYVPDNEDLYKQMDEAGYTVVLKPTVDMLMTKEELADEDHVTKGNVDTLLVMYIMKEIDNYKKAVIVSNDGDFYSVAEYLEERGKLGKILAPNYRYSALLKKFENYIERIDKHRNELAYYDNHHRGGKSQDSNAKQNPKNTQHNSSQKKSQPKQSKQNHTNNSQSKSSNKNRRRPRKSNTKSSDS